MIKPEIKEILRNYYFAYCHANGLQKAKAFKITYVKGWFYITVNCHRLEPLRKSDILRMTATLYARDAAKENL